MTNTITFLVKYTTPTLVFSKSMSEYPFRIDLTPFQSGSSPLKSLHRADVQGIPLSCCDLNRRPHLQKWKYELFTSHAGKCVSQSKTI